MAGFSTGILGFSGATPTVDGDQFNESVSNVSSGSDDLVGNFSLEVDTTHNKSKLEREIHAEINTRRQKHDLSTLKYDSELSEIAGSHSQDMAGRQYFSHVSPDGTTLSDRYQWHGYECRVSTSSNEYATGGENIAYRASTNLETNESRLAVTIVDGWMNSTGHRKNILRPYWENEGIGVNVTREGDKTAVYVTQNFC
ncbi:hypothetical protein C453_00940 [Haloferax elongans ATCC BAA-1513]|uniref:SCP domain-containing protein n=1 Tax=Haloferax elongans ATCC BAA-1513 TaxID=1230453 RepID=M0HWI0_HALEO|nr:hypothetical protein C453_00940 [Haloferax elongans ATCC BAA-1513]